MLRCVALIDFEHPMKPCPRYFSWQPKSTKCTTGDCKLETSHTNPLQQSATGYTLHVLLAGFGGCEIGLQTRVHVKFLKELFKELRSAAPEFSESPLSSRAG